MKQIAVLLALMAPAALSAQLKSACNRTGSLTSATTTTAFDNRAIGCYQWRITYSVIGFSAVTIQFEQAPDVNGAPGTWTAFTGAAVIDGTNPSTALVGLIGVHSAAAFIRLNVTSATGSGTIDWQVYGANGTLPLARKLQPAGKIPFPEPSPLEAVSLTDSTVG